jgi:hypothetical protein
MRMTLVALTTLFASCAAPPYDKESFGVRASEERLSATTYRVTVSQSGATPAAELKPRILRRVREIGKTKHGVSAEA